MHYERNRHARHLFDRIAPHYDLVAELFSFLQCHAWRRYLVSRLDAGPGTRVMDLCTGTAGVAMQVARAYPSQVVGVDLSTAMLRRAQRKIGRNGLAPRVSLVAGRAENLGFADACFYAVCVTWLLRYVDTPEATLQEIVWVLQQ